MDKHNNEIYKNWYSTNINGKKPVANYYCPLPPSRKCMMSVANIGRHAPAFFYQPSHVLKLSFMCSTESFQNTYILVTSVVNYI